MQSLRSDKGAGQGVLAVIALICIAVAVYLIIRQAKTKDETPYANAFYYCTNCEKEFTGDSKLYPPVKCPFCKQVTGARLRKYECKKCGEVFPGFISKFDMQTKRLIERRDQGENIPDEQIGSEMMTEPGSDDWVDASDQAAFDILSNITCPECGATVVDTLPIFPKSKKKK